MWIFDCVGDRHPSPCVVQGSSVYRCEERRMLGIYCLAIISVLVLECGTPLLILPKVVLMARKAQKPDFVLEE